MEAKSSMGEDDKLINISMSIILYAGNARNAVREVGKKIGNNDLTGIEELLKEAHKEFVKAHQAQTSVIQSEAKGEEYSMSILFSHAQDTLMSTQSELFMIETLYNYIRKCREEQH